jgi:hypothetical protein
MVANGERLFGYFPMSSHLVIEAADVTKRVLRDAAPHRQGVAPVYNAYARVTDNSDFEGRAGDYQALLRPLFMLSFLVDDFLRENQFFGARRAILSSASSKTAFGLAHLLYSSPEPMHVIGLTSANNADFVRSLGCYHEVVLYDHIEELPADAPMRLSTWPATAACAHGCNITSAMPSDIPARSGSRTAAFHQMSRCYRAQSPPGSSLRIKSENAPGSGAPAASISGLAPHGRPLHRHCRIGLR